VINLELQGASPWLSGNFREFQRIDSDF